MTHVLLASGGMDSFLAWYLYNNSSRDPITNVFVNLGQKYVDRERAALHRLRGASRDFVLAECTGAQIGAYELASGIIPHRNAELVLCAAQYGTRILMGVVRDEINSDKSPEFMAAMATVLCINDRPQYWNQDEGKIYTVESPVRHQTKSELLADYLEAEGNPATVMMTRSCYANLDTHCGACPSCWKRWVALRNNGLDDRETFATDPLKWGESSGAIQKARDSTYAPARSREILKAVGHG